MCVCVCLCICMYICMCILTYKNKIQKKRTFLSFLVISNKLNHKLGNELVSVIIQKPSEVSHVTSVSYKMAQRSWVTCLRPHSKQLAELQFESSSAASRLKYLGNS
jgi:hypothetical protein